MKAAESGNVMFYILIAVALLAALSYAVAMGSRASVQNLTTDRQRLLASEIVEYADTVKRAVQQLRLRGVAFNTLEFDDPALTGYANANCAAGDCMIFDPAGGAIVFKSASADALTVPSSWAFIANNEIELVGTTTGDAAGADLLMVQPNVIREVCAMINDLLDVANPSGDPPVDTSLDTTAPFTGAAAYAQTVGDEASSAALAGRTAGCFREGAAAYYFYEVLIAR